MVLLRTAITLFICLNAGISSTERFGQKLSRRLLQGPLSMPVTSILLPHIIFYAYDYKCLQNNISKIYMKVRTHLLSEV